MKRAVGLVLLAVATFGSSRLSAAGAQASTELRNWPAPSAWGPMISHEPNGAITARRPQSESSRTPAIASPTPSGPFFFVALTPCRVADTRMGFGFSGAYGPPSLVAATPRDFTVTGQCGVPTNAQAVSFNFTATNTTGPGFLVVFPSGGSLPGSSTLNFVAGDTVANADVVPLGAGGAITVAAGVSGIDLVVDVNGYYTSSGDRNPSPDAPGNALTLEAGGASIGGTDKPGGDMTVSGGIGTGLGGGGNVHVQTAGANDLSGTTDNLLVDRRIVVARAKQMTPTSPGFTSIMSILLTGTHTAGGRIFYTVRATDGGSQIATESGVLQYLATANSITCTVQTTDKLHLGTVNSGCTPGFFNPGSHPGVSIFDNLSFSSPAPIVVHEVYFTIENESGSAIRLEP